jgi:dihydrodipicolinate synthase/N-acetylneuraminate lyase
MTVYPRAMPAIITPFTTDGEVDPTAHADNVSQMQLEGTTGFVIAGSTGEGPYLETGERRTLVLATRAVAPDAFVLCGINAESVRQAITQIGEAASAGADAALVATPGTLVRDNDSGVEAFYRTVADQSTLPVFLYTVPKVTGYILPTTVINALANHGNIVGIKDSGGDPTRIPEIRPSIDAGFIVYAGASRALHATHEAGGHGAITASANYAFGLVRDAVSGDDDAQADLTRITSVIERHGVPGTKLAAGLVGRSNGHVRPPLSDVSGAAAAEIQAALDIAQR